MVGADEAAADAGQAGRQILQADGVSGGSREAAAEPSQVASSAPEPRMPKTATPPPSAPEASGAGAQARRFDGLHTVAGGATGPQEDEGGEGLGGHQAPPR